MNLINTKTGGNKMRDWKEIKLQNSKKDSQEDCIYKLEVKGLNAKIHRIKPSHGWYVTCMELRIFDEYLYTDDTEQAKKEGFRKIVEKIKELEEIRNVLVPTKMKSTGLKDSKGKEICTGHIVKLKLDNGESRKFKVKEKTVIREVINYPDFIDGTSKVAITGIVFCWEGYDLFPCVDEHGIPDNEKMTIVGVHNEI